MKYGFTLWMSIKIRKKETMKDKLEREVLRLEEKRNYEGEI